MASALTTVAGKALVCATLGGLLGCGAQGGGGDVEPACGYDDVWGYVVLRFEGEPAPAAKLLVEGEVDACANAFLLDREPACDYDGPALDQKFDYALQCDQAQQAVELVECKITSTVAAVPVGADEPSGFRMWADVASGLDKKHLLLDRWRPRTRPAARRP